MTSPQKPPGQENQADTSRRVYLPKSLNAECERRAALEEEGSVSKVIRKALREYFRRHPCSGGGP